MILHCPNCSTKIDTHDRCPATRGLGRCFEKTGHEGWHWTQLGPGGIYRWTGLYCVFSCPARLSLWDWCVRDPGHEQETHKSMTGLIWSDEPEDEND